MRVSYVRMRLFFFIYDTIDTSFLVYSFRAKIETNY